MSAIAAIKGPLEGNDRPVEQRLQSVRRAQIVIGGGEQGLGGELGIGDIGGGDLGARPGLLAAPEREGEGDTLTVWRIDRLGRSTLHLLQILDQLRSRNIAFQSIMDGIDTNTAAGRMVFSMVGAIAEFERRVISDRTRAGMAAARRRGRPA